ncbi:ChW repeat-containing protein [[Clostridium] sordellii]|uniref:immunoglobulin-like domain-containing protein n=2 Tax=Paraclostridium sordellii TaxID=1505 RepID=UPI0005DE5432|nr:immunoglobulin-like domain-containing protein [Paeniclostridium sordellii]CEP46126.1 ChW repeat-containing protein [[Clostridium] sordellii] [Paeniclostridium sordellii]
MRRRKSNLKNKMVGAITTTMIIQSIPLGVFANDATSDVSVPSNIEHKTNSKSEESNIIANSENKEVKNEEGSVIEDSKNKKVKSEKNNVVFNSENKETRAGSTEIVNIPDINLKKAINKQLSQPENSDITKQQLESIKSLISENSKITSIEGIENCTNLTILNLNGNNIQDISYLKNLNKLETLRLNKNNISDLNPLKNLINLKNLDLGINKISNIEPLSSLVNLNILELGLNKISDIRPLSNLKNLKTLRMMNNQISDLNPISSLTNLNFLNLESNQISDLNPISGLTNLDFLKLGMNKISNVKPISKLNKLTTLDLKRNNIIDISSLAGLAKLTNLNISEQKYTLKEIKVGKGKNLSITNPIIDTDGFVSNITNVSDGGSFNSSKNSIDWGNINESKDLTFEFDKNINLGKANGVFSGVITQPVLISSLPVINGADNVSIKEGTTFNPMAGVTATDTEDGNITKDIKVTGTVNIDKPGKYELTYTVTDKDGNTTTVKRIVTVNPKMIAINNIPVINAEDKTIKVGDKFNPMTGVTANDKEDGNITKDIKVIEDTVNTSKPGTYKVVYEVTDSKGATATKTITVTVISNDKPVISGADNVSIKEGTTFNPMAGVTATDTEDGNITKDIKVTGIVDTDKPGKYELTYTVTDKDGNTTTVKRTVIVNPKMVAINNIPVINGENKTIKVGDKFNPMTGITANDKEDGNITKDIKVIEDTVNTSKPGTYKVVYEVTDSKGATATKTITVTVISNDKPVISGADNVSIKEGTTFNPMAGVTATDTEDGNITKDIKVTGTVDTDKPGKYELTYTVTDKDGNTTTVKRTITVNPKIVVINSMPVINAEDKTIKVGDKFNPMAGVTAIDKEDGNITKDIKVIENTVDTSKPGTYKVVYEVTDSQGETTTKTITVTVESNNKNNMNINNITNTNNPSNIQHNNLSDETKQSFLSNPQTGDIGVMGYIGLGATALVGLFASRKKNK